MRSIFWALGLVLFVGMPVIARADSTLLRDPTGETAYYNVDHDRSRTSAAIRDGNMTTTVTGALPDEDSYIVKLDYHLVIQVLGTKNGSKDIKFPSVYFTPEFMEDLRVNGTYETDKFKIKHMGYGDARTMDGHFYQNCDIVMIYDIDTSKDNGLVDFAKLLLTGVPAPAGDFENLVVNAYVKAGVPVIGAVKLDVSGDYQGQHIKIGADYRAP